MQTPLLSRHPLVSDAVAILAVTALAYLFTFYHQKAYLEHYGINETFVYIDIDRISNAGGYIVAFIGGLAGFFGWPKETFMTFGRILYLLFPGLLVFATGLAVYLVYGFTWVSISFCAIGGPLLLYQLLRLLTGWKVPLRERVRHVRSKGGLLGYFSSTSIIVASQEARWAFACVVGAIIIRTAGGIAGGIAASSAQNYQIVDLPQEPYAIVTRNAQSVIAVGIQKVEDDPRRYRLSGKVKFLEISELKDKDVRTDQARISSHRSESMKRQSVREFIDRNAFWR